MKKLLFAICICILSVGAARADIVITTPLDLPITGAVGTNAILTSQNQGGATFDIAYTVGVTGNASTATPPGPESFANSNGTVIGVAGGNDIAAHALTLEGNDNEGLSFNGLSIINFQANDSGFVLSDFTDLTFTEVTFGAAGNNQDGVNISFTGFTDPAPANVNLAPLGATPTVDITTATQTAANGGAVVYSAPETDVWLIGDNNNSSNRWSVGGLTVTYNSPVAVPEPSSLCLLGLGMIGLVARRRR